MPDLHGPVWPSDFNADGITDLAGSGPPEFEEGTVRILIGDGTGGFGEPVDSGIRGRILGVMPATDTGRELVVLSMETFPSVDLIMVGRDLSFGDIRNLAVGPAEVSFAQVADFDDDGRTDVLIGDGDRLYVFFASLDGDFEAVMLPAGPWAHGGTDGDWNGDGLVDIAVANRDGGTITVYINQGGRSFTLTDIALDATPTDVTRRDVDADGRLDLLVSLRTDGTQAGDSSALAGHVYVLRGNGDGTFDAPEKYDSGRGADRVVTGDFNRDGLLDVATANYSYQWVNDCAAANRGWNSVTILPGRGDGTFQSGSTFALGDASNPVNEGGAQDLVAALNTADVNGDGHTDLLWNDGWILHNVPPDANDPPVVDLCASCAQAQEGGLVLRPQVSDADSDLLSFSWVHGGGLSIPPVPGPCVSGLAPGDHTFTVTVDDGQGHRVSDSMTYVIPDDDTTLPSPWREADIGDVGIPGSASYADGQFTVRGAGGDVWGTADAFHFVYQQLPGDGTIAARVAVTDGTHDWTKVGIMIRQSLEPGSAHHYLLASRAKGLAYQRRPSAGGTSLHTSLGAGSAADFTIRRTGSTLHFFMGGDVDAIATATMPEGPVYVGLAVTSHEASELAAGTFEWVRVDGGENLPPTVHLGSPTDETVVDAGDPVDIEWFGQDDGGIARYDIFSGTRESPDLVPIAGCTNLPASATTCTWNSAGPPSDTAFVLIRALDTSGLTGTDRSDLFTIREPGGGALPAGWLAGDVGDVGTAGSASYDEASGTFTVQGSGADIWDTADEFSFARLPVDSHDFSFVARVTAVENVHRWTKVGIMLRIWDQGSAGSEHASLFVTPTTEKGVAFQRRTAAGGTSVHTAGPSITAPVWLKLERFGNTISAFYRVDEDDPWTLVGSQDYVDLPSVSAMLVTSSHVDGTLATGTFDEVLVGGTGNDPPAVAVGHPTSDTPVYAGEPVRIDWLTIHDSPIVRYDLFAGGFDLPLTPIEECTNLPGTVSTCTWRNPGPAGPHEDKFVVVRATDASGLTGEDDSDTFVIREVPDGGPLPEEWSNGDVGSVAAAGSASYDADTGRFTVEGSGADIWDTADEFHFVSRTILEGAHEGLEITARVAAAENVHRWTKVGLMIRGHRGAGSPHAAIFVTPTTEKGVAFQRRPSEGAESVHTAGPALTVPIRLRLLVQGGIVHAYYRIGAGDPWIFVGQDVVDYSGPIEVGLAVGSHVDGTLARAVFDQVIVR